MQTRRAFAGGSAAVAFSNWNRILGANDRVRVGAIGTGTRGRYDLNGFLAVQDCEVVAVCDVFKPNLEKAARQCAGAEQYTDYRRVLDRKDIDAVLIATPDHWHCPMIIQACEAGKDVYCEKPLSNSLEMAQKAVAAVRKHNRIGVLGLQQRTIELFQDARKKLQEGIIGKVAHAGILFPASYTRPVDEPGAPPPDLDWEMFQGPAPRRPYSKSRQTGWRAYYDYGGGAITDWGVHLVDTVHWFMDEDTPSAATAIAQSVRVKRPTDDQVPDTFSLSWKYNKFVLTYANFVPQNGLHPPDGTYFFGERGMMLVNRPGYLIMFPQQRRNAAPPKPIHYIPPPERIPLNLETEAMVRDFIACVKTRQKPIADLDTGFKSTLPNLLALLSIRKGRTITWDGRNAKAV